MREAPATAPESITVIRLPPGPAEGRPCMVGARSMATSAGSTPSSAAMSWAVTVSCELPQNGANSVAVTPPVGPIRIRTLSAVVVNGAAAPMLWNQNSLA